ncbi:Gfo/Idh/MocA family protein [Celeribacter marinus]|uniref:Gfo/Idh/MocA family protein n=1 Tax=Celeribacter marinus TaxID=1397108 RepID=UPI003F6C1DA0
MSNPVRWGVLGAAKFAREFMARAIHEAEGAQLVALATSSAAKAEPFQAFCPELQVFTDYDALLASDTVDAIYIPLPNHLHVEWAQKALDAGKHVLVEKPVAMRADEIDGLIAKRDTTGLHCAEAYMIAHHPQWTRVRDLIAEGVIGDLVQVDVAFSYNNAADTDNIRNRAETGGGAAGDIGVYAFGCARFVTGEEPDAITSTRIVREAGVDVTTEITATFPSFSYHGYVSMRMAPYQEARFHGTKGVIVVKTPFNARVAGQAELEIRLSDHVRIETFPAVNHYAVQVENFCRTVRAGVAYPWDLENAKGTQTMIDAVFAADRA